MIDFFRFLLVSLVFTLGTTSTGHAASFDCNKATTETEIGICADPELSALDEEISEIYFSLNKDGRYYADLVNSQRLWIKTERELEVWDFKHRVAFLKFGSHLSTCLKNTAPQKNFSDCQEQNQKIFDECMELENYTTLVMNRCGAAYVNVLYLAESHETTLWRERNSSDNETLVLFNKSYELWKPYVESDCDWQWSSFREGTISGQIYKGCLMGHLEPRIAKLHRSNSNF